MSAEQEETIVDAIVRVLLASRAKTEKGYRQVARRILKDIRNPTQKMTDAGYLAVKYDCISGITYSEYSSDPPEVDSAAPLHAWHAMIDAALGEEATGGKT